MNVAKAITAVVLMIAASGASVAADVIEVAADASAPAGNPVLFVDADAISTNDGSSWANAHPNLQTALTIAANSRGTVTTIRVAQGTYMPDGARIGDGGYVGLTCPQSLYHLLC